MVKFAVKRSPFIQTGFFNSILLDYLNQSDNLKQYYDFDPTLEGFAKIIKSKIDLKLDRELLSETILNQYNHSDIEIKSVVNQNIALLKHENTFTVTTGHQLNLFSGPLYVIFKIISTINLAEKLKNKFPEFNFIPVFWMATEDHDISEINNINLFGKKLSFETDYKGPAGKMKCADASELIVQTLEMIGTNNFAIELKELIENAYRESLTLAQSTRVWIDSLVGKYGLVIIDADEKVLKNNFSKIAKKELEENFIFKFVSKTIRTLNENYEIQVNPREINLFYNHGLERNRIVEKDNIFSVLNTSISFNQEELMTELEKFPERFSPNVLMRPLYQEMILPNLAYVGGPSEIAYWMELKTVFKYLSLDMPVLLLRNCAMIVEENLSLKWKKLGFTIDDLFKDEAQLSKLFLSKGKLKDFSIKKFIEAISKEFLILGTQIEQYEPTLKPTVESELKKVINSVNSLEEKIIRASKKKQEIEILQISKVKEKLFPNNGLQERHETILPFYLKYGNEFIGALKELFDPFEKEFLILEEQPMNQK